MGRVARRMCSSWFAAATAAAAAADVVSGDQHSPHVDSASGASTCALQETDWTATTNFSINATAFNLDAGAVSAILSDKVELLHDLPEQMCFQAVVSGPSGPAPSGGHFYVVAFQPDLAQLNETMAKACAAESSTAQAVDAEVSSVRNARDGENTTALSNPGGQVGSVSDTFSWLPPADASLGTEASSPLINTANESSADTSVSRSSAAHSEPGDASWGDEQSLAGEHPRHIHVRSLMAGERPALLVASIPVRPVLHLGFVVCNMPGYDVTFRVGLDTRADANTTGIGGTGALGNSSDNVSSSADSEDAVGTSGKMHTGVLFAIAAPICFLAVIWKYCLRRKPATLLQRRDVPMTAVAHRSWQVSDDDDDATVGGPLSNFRARPQNEPTSYYSLATPRGGGL